MPVARDHLGRYWFGHQPQFFRDMRLHRRVDMREGADRPGNGAGGDFGAGRHHPVAAAAELGKKGGKLQPECGRLGMNAVAASDCGGVAVFLGAGAERRQQPVETVEKKVAGAGHLHGEGGVEDVGGCHALVNKAGFFADMFGKACQKGDHIMLGFAFDFVDAVDVEPAAFPDRFRRFRRNHPQVRHRIAGMCLDLVPDLELVLLGPDRGHLGARISGNHRGVFLCH